MASLNRRKLLGGLAVTALAAATGGIAIRSFAAERVIPIKARKFTYEPDEIVLKLNEPAILEFTTADVVMGFNAPDFKVRATIIPGQTARVRIVSDKTGTFVFHCDVFCGDGHEDMDGTIRVEK
ncbi:MAG TPA: cupredoxin domain-containing protein [Casimicrobiaceae bacterium]|nr:cupredoxin domain-containing protein [Casimicrobiaceae bacterium]